MVGCCSASEGLETKITNRTRFQRIILIIPLEKDCGGQSDRAVALTQDNVF